MQLRHEMESKLNLHFTRQPPDADQVDWGDSDHGRVAARHCTFTMKVGRLDGPFPRWVTSWQCGLFRPGHQSLAATLDEVLLALNLKSSLGSGKKLPMWKEIAELMSKLLGFESGFGSLMEGLGIDLNLFLGWRPSSTPQLRKIFDKTESENLWFDSLSLKKLPTNASQQPPQEPDLSHKICPKYLFDSRRSDNASLGGESWLRVSQR